MHSISVKQLSAEWELKLFNKELIHHWEYPLELSIFEQCDLYLTTYLVYLFSTKNKLSSQFKHIPPLQQTEGTAALKNHLPRLQHD